MKTETQIAEENIGWTKTGGRPNRLNNIRAEEHKASCQRFLDWILEQDTGGTIHGIKITDLKQAIKLYKDNGI